MKVLFAAVGLSLLIHPDAAMAAEAPARQTAVSIHGNAFHINGRPTYEGRKWRGHKVEGLLLNSRMVQGIFDDLNPETAGRWAYPDTGKWDADRNTREFVDAMPEWRRHGLLCAVVNLQGGSPEGYSHTQPWHNSAIRADGSLRPDFMARLERIINKADELGMVVMLGVFYFGQDQHLADDEAVKRAVVNTVDWIAARGYTNVLLEIANECDGSGYDRDIIKAPRVHELIELAQKQAASHSLKLPVSVSYNGGTIPHANVVHVADYLLLHGNGVNDPRRMIDMIGKLRKMENYRGQPIINNEDDRPWRDKHQGWGQEGNNFAACVSQYVSWGYFDFRQRDEGFDEGFQSVPVNWRISSGRKRDFFNLLGEITGSWVSLFDGKSPAGWRSGLIYDETRGHQRWICPSLADSRIEPGQGPKQWKWHRDGWNDVVIRCQGMRILTTINGLVIADYDGAGVLDDEFHRMRNVGLKGVIALQLHKNDRLRIAFKDILIRPVPHG